jgi:hypothetical protein
MKTANIYNAKTEECVAYLNINDEKNGHFTIYDKISNEIIAHGNIRNGQLEIFDNLTNELIEYGNLTGDRFKLYDPKNREFLKHGIFW